MYFYTTKKLAFLDFLDITVSELSNLPEFLSSRACPGIQDAIWIPIICWIPAFAGITETSSYE